MYTSSASSGESNDAYISLPLTSIQTRGTSRISVDINTCKCVLYMYILLFSCLYTWPCSISRIYFILFLVYLPSNWSSISMYIRAYSFGLKVALLQVSLSSFRLHQRRSNNHYYIVVSLYRRRWAYRIELIFDFKSWVVSSLECLFMPVFDYPFAANNKTWISRR